MSKSSTELFDILEETPDWFQLDEIDRAIFEYISENARAEKRGVESEICRLYSHMLKYIYQPWKQSGSWIRSMRQAQENVTRVLEDDVAIKSKITDDRLDREYSRARSKASKETHLNIDKFPIERNEEWNIDNIMSDDYLEDFLNKNKYSREAINYLSYE